MSAHAEERLRLLFDWASAQQSGRRLAIWLVVAVLLHAAAYVGFRVVYPAPEPAPISDATLYILLPSAPEAARLVTFLAAEDPALLAPERRPAVSIPDPKAPRYQPSYATARPQLVPLPETPSRVLPPLIRDFGPVAVSGERPAAATLPPPAARTQVVLSAELQPRAPRPWPEPHFTARPGDQLAPARFLLAVAPDGRVLHVLVDETNNEPLADAASQYLMGLRFAAAPGRGVAWGTATIHWGLDVTREEPR